MAVGPSSSYKILCFIPMKNCESTIETTLSHFDSSVTRYLTEILVIDNASMDQSVQKAKESLKKIPATVKKTLLQNSRNYGLGGSHKIAFKYAYDNGYDYMLVVHGDASVNVKQFETWLAQEKFSKFDMLLSTRLSGAAYRENYPVHRYYFNLILSFLASVITRRKISDFSSGPMNLYRVPSFINKFENPLKLYPNDVAFPQYMTLYGAYRKMDILFHPVDLYEKDKKPLHKLVSQFGKSVILLLRYLTGAHGILRKDVFGTFYGHTYRKVIVDETPVDVVIPIPTTAPTPAPVSAPVPTPVQEVQKKPDPSPVPAPVPVSRPVAAPVKELKLIDLRRLPYEDPYLESYNNLVMNTVEACEVIDDSFIHLRLNLDVETILSKGLRSFFLRLFKVYGERKIILDLNVDRVITSRQCHEFLIFCKEFGIPVHLISHRAAIPAVWELYSKLVSRVTLGFEYGSCKREEFFTTAAVISRNTELHVNIISHPKKFYYCLGLKTQLETLSGITVVVQPYVSNSGAALDHEKILNSQSIKPTFLQVNSPVHNRFIFRNGEGDFDRARASGFTRLDSPKEETIQVKAISLDEKGNIFRMSADKAEALGTIFDDSASYINKITETA